MTKKSFVLPFKSSNPEVQLFFEKLAAENSKLQNQLAECRAKSISLSNQIKALKKQHEKEKRQLIPDLGSVIKRIGDRNAEERKNRTKN